MSKPLNPFSHNLTKWSNTPNHSSATADKLFECVWPFCGINENYFGDYLCLVNIIEINVFHMKEVVATLCKYGVIIKQVNLATLRFFHWVFLHSIWVLPEWAIFISYTLETFWTLTRKLLGLKLRDIHSPSPQTLGELRGHLLVQS